MNTIKIDGYDLSLFGVVPTGSGIYRSPVRSFTEFEIPGRHGAVIYDNNTLTNVTVTYPCYISKDFMGNFGDLKSWLLSRKGYFRIEDTYDTRHFRLGYLAAVVEPEMSDDYSGGKFELTFNCKPQRFLFSGEEATRYTASIAGALIYNETFFDTYPIYKIHFSSGPQSDATVMRLNGVDIKMSYNASMMGDLTIYAETGEAIAANGTIWTSNIVTDSDLKLVARQPTLDTGLNTIDFVGNYISWIEVTPNWWEV